MGEDKLNNDSLLSHFPYKCGNGWEYCSYPLLVLISVMNGKIILYYLITVIFSAADKRIYAGYVF